MFSVTHDQLGSENTKWKIPQIDNLLFLNYMLGARDITQWYRACQACMNRFNALKKKKKKENTCYSEWQDEISHCLSLPRMQIMCPLCNISMLSFSHLAAFLVARTVLLP